MSQIAVCVTPQTTDPHEYREQIERVAAFAPRLHLDFMDGAFAPVRSLNVAQAWWPKGVTTDIHLMYQKPRQYLETLIGLQPSMVILHAEAEGDTAAQLEYLKKCGIRAGVALLQSSQPGDHQKMIEVADHVLIFSGDLGHFGGTAALDLLNKVSLIKAINPAVELGWDGGANAENIQQLAQAGIDVINVGGAIQRAADPAQMYDTMIKSISGQK